jgi:hypothetical protein
MSLLLSHHHIKAQYTSKASLLDLIKIIWLADPLLKILANIGPAPLGDSTVKINDTYLCLMGIVT